MPYVPSGSKRKRRRTEEEEEEEEETTIDIMVILLPAKFVAHKTSTGTIFLLVGLEPISNTEFVGMCMSYLYTRFYMPVSSHSLVMTIEPKAKYRFCAATILLSLILQKEK
jgi:hypothetical protein